MNDYWSFCCGSHHRLFSYLQRKNPLHLVNVHLVINMSKETVYHGRQHNVHSVHRLYEAIERDRKLKPGWKVLVGGLCTLAMSMEVINSILAKATSDSRCALIRD